MDLGKIHVGMLESGDIYGDIALNPTRVCGASYLVWRANSPRIYKRYTKIFQDNSTAPVDTNTINKITELSSQMAEACKDPNSSICANLKAQIDSLSTQFKSTAGDMDQDSNNNGIPDNEEILGGSSLSLSPQNMQALSNQMDDIVKGLGCGFGG